MSYVEPNSIVQLFQGINLDNRYMHTIYFASEGAQDTWFTSKVYKTYQQISYVRYTRNQIKIKDDATSLMGCTYLRFKNTRTNSKWFYAFINAVEYINENTALITYEIDVMQTWFIQNGTVLPCMVRREHVSDDTFSTNLESEPIGSDIYDYDNANTNNDATNTSGYFQDYSVVLSTSAEPEYLFDYGLFCGTKTEYYPANSEAQCDFIKGAINTALGGWDKQLQSADIVDLYTFPTDLMEDLYPFALKQIQVKHPSTFKGYTPKNNKLYSYPYSFLYVTTHNGDSAIYRWEYWAGDNVDENVVFGVMSNPLGGGMVECYPRDYNGITENYNEGLTINNFPKNSANVDAYQAWVASGGQTKLQNEAEITALRNSARAISGTTQGVTDIVGGFVDTGVSASAFAESAYPTQQQFNGILNGVNRMASGVSGLMNMSADIQEAQNKIDYQWKDIAYAPNIIKGKNTPQIGVSWRTLEYYFYNGHIRTDEAKRIDDFFSMFGYAVNRIKQPNLNGRQYWNFVQTENCQIAGNMPASSKEAIGRIFDGGITFWHNGDNIGNYRQSVTQDTVNNPIV